MAPWVSGRPLNLLRCAGYKCWFQRNVDHPPAEPGTFSPAVGRIPVHQKNGKTEDYLFIEDANWMIECVSADVVEFHGWGSRIVDVEKPDRLVVDLDPEEGLGFERVREAAFEVRSAFEFLELECFALLSGGKGIHVVVPIEPDAVVRNFAHQCCRTLADPHPERFTVALPRRSAAGEFSSITCVTSATPPRSCHTPSEPDREHPSPRL